ncbi:hypothetical protein ID866_13359 [Astraeus odoratus]|nr:hypothetical protein ID866_13359 [Astraeus odoratus]
MVFGRCLMTPATLSTR